MQIPTQVDLAFIESTLGVRQSSLGRAIADAEYMMKPRPSIKLWRNMLKKLREQQAASLNQSVIQDFADKLRDLLCFQPTRNVLDDIAVAFFDYRQTGDSEALFDCLNAEFAKTRSREWTLASDLTSH